MTAGPVGKSSPQATLCAAIDGEPSRLTSDLFHALSQPITALCCSLELALQRPLTTDEYRDSMTRALSQAERASWLVQGMRELFDAGQAGENCEVLSLRAAVLSAIEDAQLVAEEFGVGISFSPQSRCPVRFDAPRLRRGLFHLFGALLASAGRESVVKIKLAEAADEPGLVLAVSCPRAGRAVSTESLAQDGQPRELAQRLGIGIARAIFEAAGGSFHLEDSLEYIKLQVRLPRAVSPEPATLRPVRRSVR